jgi:CIC family chloride channel protein
VKFFGGLVAIGAGLALGREGPTIQMGGAVGEMVGRWLRATPRERLTLVAAGAGAGLSAAFNAPLAGLVFVLEEVQRDFAPGTFTSSLVAGVTADIVTRWLTGQDTVFHIPVASAPPLRTMPAFAVLGLFTGLLGVAFSRALVASLELFERARGWPAGLTGVLAGAGAGLCGWFLPSAVGTGGGLLDTMLAGKLTLGALGGLFALRFFLTMLSYGSGAPGGIFAPLLVLGAQIGLMIGGLTHFVMASVPAVPVDFAVVGMAAYFAAIVRAPLTGIVLIVEMTGGYSLMLPLLLTCFVASATADLAGDLPIYERLLERELSRGQAQARLEGTLLLELAVQPGAPFDGKEVRELELPPGCVLVAVRAGRTERVPMPDRRISAGERLVVVVAEEAAGAIGALREGAMVPRRDGGSGPAPSRNPLAGDPE